MTEHLVTAGIAVGVLFGLLVLASLFLAAWESRGARQLKYTVATRIHQEPDISTPELTAGLSWQERGYTYTALRMLQRDGIVVARWDNTGDRPCRRFTLKA